MSDRFQDFFSYPFAFQKEIDGFAVFVSPLRESPSLLEHLINDPHHQKDLRFRELSVPVNL